MKFRNSKKNYLGNEKKFKVINYWGFAAQYLGVRYLSGFYNGFFLPRFINLWVYDT